MRQPDSYKEIKTFTYSNAIVRVHIPDLDADEKKRRMDAIKKAAINLLIDAEKKGGLNYGTL